MPDTQNAYPIYEQYIYKNGNWVMTGGGGNVPTVAPSTIPIGNVTSNSTTEFTATVPGVTELVNGTICYISNNNNQTSAEGWTLNVNGLGAYPVYQSQAVASRTTTIFNKAYTGLFIFNTSRVSGGCWDYVYGYNSDTNTTAYQIRRNNGTYLTKTALYRYMLLLSYSETELLPINTTSNSTATTKILTTESFDPFGPIFYYATTTAVTANAAPDITRLWKQYTLDLRYSFNTGSTLTSNKDVFIKATPQANGKAKLDTTTPIVQTLPSTNDGSIYIYLGHAYSTTSIVLTYEHPIYYYNSGIKLWTGVSTLSDLTNDAYFVTDENYVHTDNNYTDTEQSKLSGIAAGAEVNQNAYTTIKVGSTDVTSNSKTGTFTVTAGTGIGLTPNTTSKSMEIKNIGVTNIAESSTNGKLSVTQNGETNNISIHGLGTAAYQDAGHFYETTTSHSAHQVLAAPSDSAGVATFRTLAASDIPALNYVPTGRTVNGKELSSNISLTASDVSAVATSAKGVANGVAELDANGLVPSSQLPSYVDDVVEYSALSNFPATGETGKIYVDTNSKKIYRWSGSQYTEISASLALGTTSSTAFAGDKGQTAYTHATDSNRLTTAKSEGLYKIATTTEGHIKSATAVAKADITALGIPGSDTTYVFDGTYNASTNKAATVATVTSAINALDVASSGTGAITGFGAGKTLATLTETNGKISATFQNISITKSQITDFPTSLAPTAHTHTVSITPTTSSIYQITSVGSVTAGKSGSVTTLNLSKFNGGTFTQGTDSFTSAAFQTGFYTAGTKGTPTVLNLSKFSGGSYSHSGFNGGSFTRGTFTGGSFTRGAFTGGSFTQGAFSGGSFTRGAFTGGSFTQGAFTGGSLTMTMDSTDTKKMILSFTAATHASDTFVAATHASDTFSPATHASDKFTAATHANDTFTAATHAADTFTPATYGTDSFTAAAFQSGFYTVGSATTPATINTSKFNGGSFTQGTDSFTSAAFGTGFYSVGTAATPTVVTLPTRASVTVWTGVSSAIANANS